jgi:hypothetical protein
MDGIRTLPVNVSMVLEKKPGGNLSKTIILKNILSLPKIKGKLTVASSNQDGITTIWAWDRSGCGGVCLS